MIRTLPNEIQNKIFYYVPGYISTQDLMRIITIRKLKSILPLNIWWRNIWSERLLYKISNTKNWCNYVFYVITHNRKGLSPDEMVFFLLCCWEIVYYLHNESTSHYGASVNVHIANNFLRYMYRDTPWVLRKRRQKTQIHYITYSQFSDTYKKWKGWDETQKNLVHYLLYDGST